MLDRSASGLGVCGVPQADDVLESGAGLGDPLGVRFRQFSALELLRKAVSFLFIDGKSQGHTMRKARRSEVSARSRCSSFPHMYRFLLNSFCSLASDCSVETTPDEAWSEVRVRPCPSRRLRLPLAPLGGRGHPCFTHLESKLKPQSLLNLVRVVLSHRLAADSDDRVSKVPVHRSGRSPQPRLK